MATRKKPTKNTTGKVENPYHRHEEQVTKEAFRAAKKAVGPIDKGMHKTRIVKKSK